MKNGTPKNVHGYRKIVALSEISELDFARFLRLASPMPSFQLLLLLLFADRSWSHGFVVFFFPSGLQEKNFSEFMVTAGYRTESSILVGFRQLPLAFSIVFFVTLFVSLSRNCFGLGFDKNAEVSDSNFEARVSTSLELTLFFPLALLVFPFFSFCSGISPFCLTRFQSILSCNFRDTGLQNSR